MKVRTIDEAFETPAQRARRARRHIESYARRGWGVDDIQQALKRQHGISAGRNAIRAVVWHVHEHEAVK